MELLVYPLIQQIFIECFVSGPDLDIGNAKWKTKKDLVLESVYSGQGYRQLK
jgi:hypothetical protein